VKNNTKRTGCESISIPLMRKGEDV